MTSTTQLVFLIAVIAPFAYCDLARSDTFGSGANTFEIEFVDVGNPGNQADLTGAPNPAGSVAVAFRMGKYEVSEQMIDKANALGGLGIAKRIISADKPAFDVSWNQVARFVNWLNINSGSSPAYKFAVQPDEVSYDPNVNAELWTPSDAGYNLNNPLRNRLARYFLPSIDEWYKAAYYDPVKGVYYDYPTGSNTLPTPVIGGIEAGTAVWNGWNVPADIMLAGGLSAYGTMGQGGNVNEWLETPSGSPANTSGSLNRFSRGGNFVLPFSDYTLSSSDLGFSIPPQDRNFVTGFRVASLPEPSTAFLGAMATLTIRLIRGRHRIGEICRSSERP